MKKRKNTGLWGKKDDHHPPAFGDVPKIVSYVDLKKKNMSFRRFTVLPSGIQQWKVFNWHFARAHPNGFFGVNGILHVWIKQPHLYNPVWIVVDYALC